MRNIIAPKPAGDAPPWAFKFAQDIVNWIYQIRRGPQVLTIYAKANLPKASEWRGGQIQVSDDVGGEVPAFCDGANWRRVTDRAVIS